MDKLGFMEGASEPVEDAQVTDTSAAEVAEQPQVETQPRDGDGRFAPKAAPEPQPEVIQPPVQEAPKEPQAVPLATFLDMRDKLKEAEGTIKAFQTREQPKPEPAVIPDMFADPEGYNAAINQTFEQKLYQQQLQMSERFAKIQHGEETTNAALDWGRQKCAADPYFNAQVMASGDPVGFTVQQFQRDRITTEVTPEAFAEFQAWKAAQAQASPQLTAPAAASPTPSAPPRSINSAPSSGGAAHVPQGPGQAYDGLFNG